MHDFYQLSLSVNPIVLPTTMLKVGEIDLDNDNITKVLYNLMKISIKIKVLKSKNK